MTGSPWPVLTLVNQNRTITGSSLSEPAMLPLRAASPFPQETLEMNIWQLEGGPFCFSTTGPSYLDFSDPSDWSFCLKCRRREGGGGGASEPLSWTLSGNQRSVQPSGSLGKCGAFDTCRGPRWSSWGLRSRLIFLTAAAVWVRHFTSAFIFKCKAPWQQLKGPCFAFLMLLPARPSVHTSLKPCFNLSGRTNRPPAGLQGGGVCFCVFFLVWEFMSLF